MNKGFTIIELLVVITMVALLAAVGVPSMEKFMQRNRVATTANDWLTSMMQTRVEALKIRQTVEMCASTNPFAALPDCSGSWEQGWVIFADTDEDGALDSGETIIDVHGPVPGTLSIKDGFTSDQLTFSGNGLFSTSSISNTTLSVCGDNSATSSTATDIIVTTIGRARTEKATTSSPVDCS